MNRDRLEELLWERIDGTISPGDLAELEAHLAEHPQPRELERDINKLAEMLDDPDEVVPPAELRARIERSLEAAAPPWSDHRAAPKPVATLGFDRVLPRWAPIAASLVIGVAIGYLLHTGPTAQIDTSQVTGSMTTPAAYPDIRPSIVDLGDSIGSIEIQRLQETVILDFQFEEADGLELIFELPDGDRTAFDLDGPRVRHLVFDCREALRLEVRKDGEVVAKQRIEAFVPEANP